MLLESRIARALRVCPKGALACLPLGMALNQSFIGAEVACRLCRALIKSDNTCRIIPISVPCGAGAELQPPAGLSAPLSAAASVSRDPTREGEGGGAAVLEGRGRAAARRCDQGRRNFQKNFYLVVQQFVRLM